MAGLALHWEATAPGVREVYEALAPVLAPAGFYLAGGTALALYEAHRISVDLDFFAPSIGEPEALAQRIGAHGLTLEVTSVAVETLYLRLNQVQVSCIGLRWPPLEPAVEPAPGLIPLASRDDLAAMKLAAVASRGSRKDFVDLWVLITRGMTLDECLRRYRAKYQAHDTGHLVRSLVFFDDADREPELRLLAPIVWERVKADFRRWVAKLLP